MTTPETWQKTAKAKHIFQRVPEVESQNTSGKTLSKHNGGATALWPGGKGVAEQKNFDFRLCLCWLFLPLLLILSTISTPKLHSWWIWADAPKSSSCQKWLPWMREKLHCCVFCKQPADRSIVLFTFNSQCFIEVILVSYLSGLWAPWEYAWLYSCW